jgi:hypothetical protein
MLVAAAFVPIPPLLVPEIAGGSAAADEPMRVAVDRAVRRALATAPDEIVAIGTGDVTGEVQGSWDWRGFGVPLPSSAAPQRLPHALGIGDWLLDRQPGPTAPRRFRVVTTGLTAQHGAELGREIVNGSRRLALLVCGDGSACRSEKAPGYLDPGAEAWDDAALIGLRTPDPARLLALDEAVGRRLLAAGRAPWQVLAGAAAEGEFEATIDWAGAPYGVLYVAGTWIRKDDPTT